MPQIIRQVTCFKCGRVWYPRKPGRPHQCPERACRSLSWDEPSSQSPPILEDEKGKILAMAVGYEKH